MTQMTFGRMNQLRTIVKIKRVGCAVFGRGSRSSVGGALSQLNLGVTDNKERKIFTDQ